MWIALFAWVGWNALLALCPVVAAYGAAWLMRANPQAKRRKWLVASIPLLFVWFIFLPNTSYLLTEWRHFLDWVASNPRYYTIYHDGRYPPAATERLLFMALCFFLYSAYGLVTLCLAVRPVVDMVPRTRRIPFKTCVFTLCSFGTYLGLVLRLNSFQIHDRSTWEGILHGTLAVGRHPSLAIAVVAFGLLLWGVYEVMSPGLARFAPKGAVQA